RLVGGLGRRLLSRLFGRWSGPLLAALGRPRLRLAAEPRDRAARALDLLARAGGEEVRGHGQLLRQVTVAEDLDVESRVPDQAGFLEHLGRHLAVEALEIADVDRVDARAVWADGHRVPRVRAALLAEAHVDRHLPALEAGPHLVRPRAGLLALDAAAGVAALAPAQAAADALSVLARGGRLERIQAELLVGH